MFQNMWLNILFDMFLDPSLKMTTSFANVASASTFCILGKISNHQELKHYMKKTFF